MADLAAALGRLAGRGRVGRSGLALAGGLLAAAGQAPFAALWLALPGLALVLGVVASAAGRGVRTATLAGWWAGVGYFGFALVWIVQPFFVDPVRHGWMAPFAIVLMSGGLALFWAGAAAFAAWTGRSRIRLLAGLVVGLAAAELLRSYIFTGFPWALIGHVWIGWPGMQVAALTGPVGLTLAALIPAALTAGLTWRGLASGAAAVAAVMGAGAWLAAGPLPPVAGPMLRLVQPNVAQSLKWDNATANSSLDNLLTLTAAAPAPGTAKPDLIIWPETALPYLFEAAGPLTAEVAAAGGGARLLIGAIRIDGFRAFNSVLDLRPGGEIAAIYDKHHLVPFGEYVPLPWLMTRIGLRAMTAQQGYGYTAGPGPRLIDLGPLGRVLPLICYEAIFPQDLRTAERPDWLLQVTNDAWFGSFSGPHQHFAQARLRAVEAGLPLVRVANTGISGVIDARGGVVAAMALGTRGRLDVALPGALGRTPYSRTGDLPWAVMLGGLLAGLALTRRHESD